MISADLFMCYMCSHNLPHTLIATSCDDHNFKSSQKGDSIDFPGKIENPLHVQMSKAEYETILLHIISSIMVV